MCVTIDPDAGLDGLLSGSQALVNWSLAREFPPGTFSMVAEEVLKFCFVHLFL